MAAAAVQKIYLPISEKKHSKHISALGMDDNNMQNKNNEQGPN